MNYIDSLLNENNNSTTNSNGISFTEADPLLKQMQEDAEQRYYNQLSGSTYSSEPKKLSLDEIAAKKEARLAKKRDELIEDDSNLTLKAKSLYNTVNDIWDGEDLKANYMGKTHSMSNKIFEDVDATMEESQLRRQELIDQYNTAEDNPNAKHKVYQLRLKEGFDQNGNPIYSYKTGIAETSAAERYKNQYIKDGYEILSEKGFAGAEEWENRWHGLKANLADRTYDEGINSQGQKIKDLSSIGDGYSEVYNTQAFDFGKTDQEIAQNMANSQNLSDIKAERLREGYGRGSDSIVDAIQAGGLKTLADTGDIILDFITPGDNTFLNDAKDQTKIDKYVGYNRKTADRAIGEATEHFKNGNYAKAAWEIYKEPQIIAESIPAMAEMLLGFGKFTKAGKLAMGVDAANKAGDAAAVSKLTKELAENVSNSQKAMYRVAQNAGLLTFAASQTNNQIEERVKNNQQAGLTGGDSIGEVATVFASNLALYGLDRGLFTKITGIGGGKAALSDAFGFANTQTKKNIMTNVAGKMLAAGTAGGAEGFQEWVQTWGEIINEQLGTGANGGKTFQEIIRDSKNIDEAIGGMLAGTVGGTQMRQASDTAYTIADKALGISAGKEYVEKANERERYTFTSGSNWFDEPLKNMSDPTYDEAVKFNTDLARTRGEIKNTSMDKVANAIFGKTQISDINGNSIMPEDAISNSIDTLRSLHFTENAYNTRIDSKDLDDALLIENEVERQEKISDIEFRKKARKLGGLNEYSNDMIDTFSNLYQKISDPKRNQNPENIAKAQELITQKFLDKINQEQDEEIKNVLLSKFTNELISDLVEKTIKANSSDSEVKNKSFGSQPENLLFSENGDAYIQGLKDIQKKVFGSQMDPNAPSNPIANELNNKIQLFQKEYEEYKRRLANAPTEEERNKIIRAKNAADVTRETVDGAGFIMDITKPNKKSIFGHMNAISRNISKIDSSTRDSYTQAKSNSLTGMLAPIDQLTEFARKKSRNMDVYNDIISKYQEAQTVEEKLEVARDLFKKGQELSDLRETINLNTTTRAEIEALAKSIIPSYRMDLDNIARDKNPNNQPSTGSAMIYESRKFIEALESTKAMLLNKIEGKERLLSSGSLKSIKNAEGLVRKDIDTMKLKLKLIDSTIEQQVQKIDHIANARIVLADPIVSTELARLRNTKENAKAEAKVESAKTEVNEVEVNDIMDANEINDIIEYIEANGIIGAINETIDANDVKTYAEDDVKAKETYVKTEEAETKTEEVPAVEDNQKVIENKNVAEQNVEENITENVEPEVVQANKEIKDKFVGKIILANSGSGKSFATKESSNIVDGDRLLVDAVNIVLEENPTHSKLSTVANLNDVWLSWGKNSKDENVLKKYNELRESVYSIQAELAKNEAKNNNKTVLIASARPVLLDIVDYIIYQGDADTLSRSRKSTDRENVLDMSSEEINQKNDKFLSNIKNSGAEVINLEPNQFVGDIIFKNEINQGELNEENNGENESRGRGEENRTEQTGDSETETKNQERQTEDERDGSRSETVSTTREKNSRETSEVTKSEKNKYKKYRNEVIERAEKILSDNPGMTISKATEIAISDIVEENYEDSNYSFDDEYIENYADREYKEIDDEIKSLKRELFEVENAEKSIYSAKEKKSKIEESKQRAIDVAKRIFAKRKNIEERLKDLQEEISEDEAKLKELELQHSENFRMDENEKKIVSKVITKENKKSIFEKDTEKISKIGKSVELKNKKIAEIDSKIEMLEKINSNENMKDKRKAEINQRLRELNYRKEKLKYNLSENQDNDITLALKEYNQTMDKLDQAEVGSREYTELSLASKTSFRRYLNEKTIDKEIRKNIIESLESRIEKDKSPFKEENREIIEKAIEDVKNYNTYQDLAKNRYTILGYLKKDGKKEPIDRHLVLKGDIPQYLVDYSNMDNSSKGYIKLKLSKKQFSERLRDGILKSDDPKTIESKVLENYYKMKGSRYKERIKMLYPTDRDLKSFESVLLNQLAFVFQAKTIDTDATFMKPVSLSPENFKEVNGKPELSKDAKVFNSRYKNELDNPSISIENGQIVAKIKDENGNDIVLDNNMYDINTLALVFGTKEKNAFGTTANFVTVPDYAEEIMRTELIKELGNMYSVQYIDPEQNDGEDFNNIWGVDPLDDRAEDLRYFIKDTFADKGYIPASVIIKSLGEKIYKSLPMSFDKSNIEKDAEAKIANQLAIYALSAVSRKNGLGLSIYTSQQDLDSTELIQGKINDTMTANIPVSTSRNEATGEEKTTVSKLNLIRLNQNQAKDLIALSSILEYTDPSREGTMPSNKPIETTSDTIKNKTTPKSELAKETILDYQSVGYRIEKNIKELYDLWKNEKTRNFAYQIAGILNPDPKLNAREYRKKLSKNKNERIQFDVLMRFFEEKGNDKEFYIKWDMIASGRYMEDSRITPQNNKITRFLLSTIGTRTEIEFTKDEDGKISLEPEVIDGIRKSLAQSLDYGLDKDLDTFVIEKMSKDIVINEDGSIEFKDTEKGNILKQAFNSFLASVKDDSLTLRGYGISRIKKLHDVGEGFHAYQAIRELAKFSSEREAFISGSESNHKYDAHFVTEADGITSGMMIILSQMMTDSAQSLFEKGGIYTKEAVRFWTHTAKALGLEEELKKLGKNTLKDGKTQQKITHGLLNRIGKIVSDKESGGKAKEKLRAYWSSVGMKPERINELVERANFKDFYNTVAHSVTGKIKSMKNEIDRDIKKLENEEKQKGALEEWKEKRLERLRVQYALIDVVGDEIARSMAKDPVMVFIYGSSLGSIKNKILNGLIGDSIQNILNNPEKIKEELTRKDGSQSLGRILQSIGINPYVENGEIVFDLDKKVKVFDIVRTNGIDDLVEVKKDKISLKDSNKIFVSSEMLGELFQSSFSTYGKAFEESFKENFGFINRYRDILKAIEMVRFQVFDKKFEEKVNALINKMSYTDSNGNRIEYNPTNGELDIILKELVDEGFGHVIRDINGGYHSFEKTERSNSDRRHSLRTIHNHSDKSSLDSTTANSLGIRQHVSNVGAAPVTSVHNQDGWQIRYATIKKNLGVQNIFDALISGLKNHDEAVEMYNNGFAIANSLHSILETQLADMEKIIDSLSETDRKNMFENMSEEQAKDIIFVYDKIRNIDNAIDAVKFTKEHKKNMSDTKVKEIVNPEIELNIAVNSMIDNSIDVIKAASTPLEDVSIGHLYATDSAPQYVGSLGGIKDTKANPETVFNAFFELIGNALFKSGRFDNKIDRRQDISDFTNTKYLVENKILNDKRAKSKIMKTFDTMINKKVSDNARAEINNIIEKLVNCKP